MFSSRQSLRVILLLPAVVAGCAMLPPEQDPVYVKQSELDSRLSRVERVIDNQGLAGLLQRIEQVQRENQGLRNDIDLLRNELEQGKARQRDQYVDVDRRLQAIEKGGSSRPTASGGPGVLDGGALRPGQLPVPGGSDRANYQAAFELLKQGRYKEANSALRQFMIAFPDSSLSDNAQYWLAETHYVSQRYDRALSAFQVVIDKYPQSRKIPDALLKIGYCNLELKRPGAARKALQTVVATYPETTAARLASERLRNIGEGSL